jgi:hypothetical protein
VKENIGNIMALFDKWDIKDSQYTVCAGFDEFLIQTGVGYLEQIHVFTSAIVDANSSLLPSLGKILSPFPAVLFTESASHQIPVFKDGGTAWDFDELVYSQASRFFDADSSIAMLSNKVSLAQSTGQGSAPAIVSQGHTKTGKGKGNGNIEQGGDGYQEEGDLKDDGTGGSDAGDGQREEGDSKDDSTDRNDASNGHGEEGDPTKDNGTHGLDSGGLPDGDPEDPMAKREKKLDIPQVSFDVLAKIYGGGDRLASKVFQDLQMEGKLIGRVCCHNSIKSLAHLVSRQSHLAKLRANLASYKLNLQS